MNKLDVTLDWVKMSGLIPAIVQHAETGQVLMLGYMNEESYKITQETRQLTLYSRSKQRLWHKGETSGNTMQVLSIATDCDQDSLLIQVLPEGPACHLGYTSCFSNSANQFNLTFLCQLIKQRACEKPEQSYTAQLTTGGLARCAQKVGEEAVETVIAALKQDQNELIAESADLIFHLLVLLEIAKVEFYEVISCLQRRHSLNHTD